MLMAHGRAEPELQVNQERRRDGNSRQGPNRATTVCQLHMRYFQDGEELTLSTELVPALGVDAQVRGQQIDITIGPGANELSVIGYTISAGPGNLAHGQVLVVRIGDTAKNRPPIANADTERVVVGNSVKIPVTANDVDPIGQGLTVSVLVPNLKGAERAIDSGAHAMLLPLSASHAHSLANLRKTPDDVVAELARIRAARDASGRPTLIEGGVGTAFGCTLQGRVETSEVLRLMQALLDAGADRVSLADTVGYADPVMVSRLFERVLGTLCQSKIGECSQRQNPNSCQ